MADETRRIPIIVREKVAKLVNPDELPLVCGNNDYVVEFDFDDAWANYPAKTALFVFGSDSVPVVFEGNVCKGVAIKNATECAIGVFAGDIRTTTGAYMPCVLSIADLGKTPKAPTKDVYNQIMDLLQKAIQAHTELPVGGKKGQVLKKQSDEDYDTAWEDLGDFQEKLPENDGGTSHRVYVAAPHGFKNEYGEEVKYYLKRIAGYDGTGKSASNGDIGIVTKANRDKKVSEGLITTEDGAYTNYIEHDEPTSMSIACRDKEGRLVIEDAKKPFHAVNKRQLQALEKSIKEQISPSKIAIYSIDAPAPIGWYRIAKTEASGKSSSNIFKITVQCQGGAWSDLIMTAAQCFDNTPQIAILSHQRRSTGAITDIRIVYDTDQVNTDNIAYTKTPSYLEVYTNRPIIQIAVCMLGDISSIQGTGVNVANEWELTDITLTETLETDFIEYKKSATDTVWADVTATSKQINEAASGGGSAKLYLHRLYIGSNYSDEEWYDNPSFWFEVAIYRTNNTPITSLSDVSNTELINLQPTTFTLWDAPEATRLALRVSHNQNWLYIDYIDVIGDEWMGTQLSTCNIASDKYSISDTVTEV